MQLSAIRARLGTVLNEANARSSPLAFKVQTLLFSMIIISSLNLILETVPELAGWRTVFLIVEAVTMIFFTIEYIGRLWCYQYLNGDVPGLKGFLKYLFSFYSIIDILVLVPFYFFVFTGMQTDWMRILRILRLIRITAYMHSDNIMLAAFKNKSLEMKISLELFSFLVIVISVVFFFIEHSAQPENFTSILSAFSWSLSKLIRGIGGYADFSPITIPGKILATLLGILLIGLFAIPAGVLASGFVDEISKQKKRAKGKEILEDLREAFRHENLPPHIRAKEEHNITGVRKYLTLADANTKLYIPIEELLAAIKNGNSFRLKNYRFHQIEHTIIEHFEENAPYGVFFDRASPITVIATYSGDQAFIGHHTARLAETLQANYISAEMYSAGSLRDKYRLNFCDNPGFAAKAFDAPPVFTAFKSDLAKLVRPGSLAVVFKEAEETLEEGIHLLNGAPERDGDAQHLSCRARLLRLFAQQLEEKASALSLAVHIHEDPDAAASTNLERYLHDGCKAELVCLHITPSLLYGSPDAYYGSIRLLADCLQKMQAER